MPAQEKLSQNEQILAYLAGVGIVIIIVALFLTAIGTVEEDLATSLLLVGVVIVGLAIAGWLFMLEPWRRFDDLVEPHYTGHEEQPDAEAMVAAAEPAGAEVMSPAMEVETPVAEDLVAHVPSDAEALPAPDLEAPVARDLVEEAPPEGAQPPAVFGETAVIVAEEPETSEPPPVVAPAATAEGRDELTRIDGIGPRSAAALYEAGITTFTQLAAESPEALEKLLREKKVRLVASTATWPRQAELAAKQDWTALAALQERIRGGVLSDER